MFLCLLNKICSKYALILFFLVTLIFFQNVYAEDKSDEKEESSVITILNANKTEYAKDPVTQEEVIVLTGAVKVSVEQGTLKTNLSSSKMTYNRKTNMLYAEGGVVMEQSGGTEGNQKIDAQTVLFNTITHEGIFDGGRVVQSQSEAINLPANSTLSVSSKMFGKDTKNTVVFKRASLTFCDDENPHWKIRASRIWILPGNEFAFLNALLFVGSVPVLYLPGFYYPKDEIIFNPTFGYDTRRGYYFQTTTYVYGRKGLDSDDDSSEEDDDLGKGLYNFMKATKLKEQKREGIVLHNLDEDFKGDTSNYFKFMADYYSTLGATAGFDGELKPKKYISELKTNLNLGFSNTVFPDSSSDVYSTYSSSGKEYKDSANLLGFETPFRYSGNFYLKTKSPFNFKLSMPFYSDPFFTEDFGDRKEYMDWISFLSHGAKDKEDEDEDEDNEVSSFEWNASASYSFPVPQILKPYISSISIENISTSLNFTSKTNSAIQTESTDNWYLYTPERMFFYPSQITPIKLSAKVQGTLYEYPSAAKPDAKTSFPIPLSVPEEFKSQEDENQLTEDKSETEPKSGSEEVLKVESLPLLDVPSPGITELSGLNYKLSYMLSPQYNSQFTYDSSTILEPEDFDFNNQKSTYFQVTSPFALSSNLSFRNSFFNMKNVFTYTPLYQEHPTLNGYSESEEASVKKTDYAARRSDLIQDNDISLKPLIYNPVLKNTSLDWNTTIKLFRTQFIGDADNPEWDYLVADVTDEESVTEHTLSATLAADESENISQRLILSTTLPPQTDEYNAKLKLNFPYTELNFATGIKKTEDTSNNETVERWKKLPFQQSASLKFLEGKMAFTQSFNYELEDDYADSFKLAFSWSGLELSYTAAYTYGYDFDVDSGWNIRDEKEFQPETFSVSYISPSKKFRYWKNRVTWAPSLNTGVVYDIIRPTNSYFKFIPALTFKINNFVNITFSSESRNNVIYRYFQEYTDSGIEIPGETNLFKDLFNSFAFWGDGTLFDEDQLKRKSSGFKLKNVKVTVTHDLHDWDLHSSFEIKPRLITNDNGTKSYNFDPYMTLSIVWRPMGSMRTEIVDEYGELQLNP